MAVGDAHVLPGFLTPVLTQLFLPKPPTTFLTCFCRGERRKYAGKQSRLNRGSNSQPPGHESDTLTTAPPGRGVCFVTGLTRFILLPFSLGCLSSILPIFLVLSFFPSFLSWAFFPLSFFLS